MPTILLARASLFSFTLSASTLLAAVSSTFAQQPAPSATTAAIIPLDPWLTSVNLWQTTPETFVTSVRAFGFRWVSQAHDAARTAYPWLRLHDLPVSEVIARFSLGTSAVPTGSPGVAPAPAVLVATGGQTRLSNLQVSIYNRGDAGDLDQKGFNAIVEHARSALNAMLHTDPVDRGADNGSAVQSRGLVWSAPGSRYLLEWSATPENKVQGIAYRAEFIRLRVTPLQDQGKGFFAEKRAEELAAGRAQPSTIHASALPTRVVKNPDGSRQLAGIPMVDQGQKGY